MSESSQPNQGPAPAVAVVTEAPEGGYQPPSKLINSPDDLTQYLKSSSCKQYLGWLQSVNDAVKGKKLTATDYPVSPVIDRIVAALDTLSNWVDDIPPLEQPMRFGNKAFRTWMERLEEKGESVVVSILPDDKAAAAVELFGYFKNSFGNKTRIDYGTGHETYFAVFLYCLERLSVLKEEDHVAIVFKVFNRYIKLMRKIQRTYFLEPAGSHGVWSLDDYQFLPFFFGSAQLIGHPHILPKSSRSKEIVEGFESDYMYFGCINFILTVKTGPFGEHSPVLNSVAEVPNWEKVNQGMMKMYLSEVIGKFPVFQHQLFGSLFPFSP